MKYYQIKQTIAEGKFGLIRTALRVNKLDRFSKDCSDFLEVVVKTIPKCSVEAKMIKRESKILGHLDHPRVLRLIDTCEDDYSVHLITEYCKGQTLQQTIEAKKKLGQEEVVHILKILLQTVNYLHTQSIVHRDIKAENVILLDQKDPKIIDFGLSRFLGAKQVAKARVGSPFFMAPEVISQKYTKSCDVWSVGVLAYYMLSGKHPFTGESIEEVFGAITNYKLPKDWSDFSPQSKDLVSKLLEPKPHKRITASKALKHSWFSGEPKLVSEWVLSSLLSSKKSQFVKQCMGVAAKCIDYQRVKPLIEMFEFIDYDKKGYISCKDLKRLLSTKKFANKIYFSEFFTATFDLSTLNEEVLHFIFKHFDLDNDGLLSDKDLQDLHHNSNLNFEEFKSVLCYS